VKCVCVGAFPVPSTLVDPPPPCPHSLTQPLWHAPTLSHSFSTQWSPQMQCVSHVSPIAGPVWWEPGLIGLGVLSSLSTDWILSEVGVSQTLSEGWVAQMQPRELRPR
jgi:hypothetical protein